MRSKRVLWTIAGGAAVAGCTLSTSLDDLTGGVSRFDAGGPVDGSANGATGDAGVSFCGNEPMHLLCDDFDTKPLPGPWTGTQVTLGSVSIDNSVGRSSPRSLDVSLSTTTTSASRAQAFLVKGFGLPSTSIRFAFDMRVDAIDDPKSTATLVIGTMLFRGTGTAQYGVQLVLVGTSLQLLEEVITSPAQGGTTAKHPVTTASVGEWNRFRIEVSVASQIAAVWRDEKQLASVIIVPSLTRGTPLLGLGVSASAAPSPGASAHFDNVTIDAM